MKKSFFFRSLQVATAVSVYSAIYIWASNAHLGSVYSLLNGLDEFLLVLALAVIFPYVCFKGLSKLTTPPSSLNREQSSKFTSVYPDQQDPLGEQQDVADSKTMQYRGTSYYPDTSENLESNTAASSKRRVTPVTKYRGVQIGDIDQDVTDSGSNGAEVNKNFAEDRQQQKSARPQERIKYRGAYID